MRAKTTSPKRDPWQRACSGTQDNKLEVRAITNTPRPKVESKFPPLSPCFFCSIISKKVTVTIVIAFFFHGSIVAKKATTPSWRRLFSVVVSQKRRRRQQLPSPFSMGLLQKMATITIVTFFSGFVTKKVTATMLLPFSMVMVLWRRQWQHVVFFFLFLWSLGLVH